MIRSVHQIEVTSRCNLRCAYCPSPNLQRPKVDMSTPHFLAALEHATKCYRAGTQFELNLAGIGESTLHPDFALFIRAAREMMPAIKLVFATNGLNFAMLHEQSSAKLQGREHMRDVVAALQAAKKTGQVEVWVSLHRPERAGLAVEVLREAGLLGGVSADPSLEADDWAGQVKWKRSFQQRRECVWLKNQQVMVLADGRVTTCCLDASGAGVIGHVETDSSTWNPKPFSLCKTCQYAVPKEAA